MKQLNEKVAIVTGAGQVSQELFWILIIIGEVYESDRVLS